MESPLINEDKMRKFICILFAIPSAFLIIMMIISSIFLPKTILHHNTRVEVNSVYMHNVDSYSYSIIDKNGVLQNKRTCANNIVIVNPELENSLYLEKWSEIKQFMNYATTSKSCELHIRSIDYIRDSGWNYGKFGSGKTKRIQ